MIPRASPIAELLGRPLDEFPPPNKGGPRTGYITDPQQIRRRLIARNHRFD
jgi:hypothetical protein